MKREIVLSPAISDWTQMTASSLGLSLDQDASTLTDGLTRELVAKAHVCHAEAMQTCLAQLGVRLDRPFELHRVVFYQETVADFLERVEPDDVLAGIRFSNLGSCELVMSSAFARQCVYRMIGGDRGSESVNTAFSRLEKQVLHVLFAEFKSTIELYWRRVVDADKIEVLPDVVSVQSLRSQHDQSRCIVEFHVKMASGSVHCVSMSYPSSVFRVLAEHAFSVQERIYKRIHLDDYVLDSIPVDVCCALGQTTLAVTELRQLSEGDVIPLTQRLSDPVQVSIAGDCHFPAQPGIVSRRIGVKLLGTGNDPVVSEVEAAAPDAMPVLPDLPTPDAGMLPVEPDTSDEHANVLDEASYHDPVSETSSESESTQGSVADDVTADESSDDDFSWDALSESAGSFDTQSSSGPVSDTESTDFGSSDFLSSSSIGDDSSQMSTDEESSL